MRFCNAFILACIIIPVIGLFFIDVEKGKQEALVTAQRDAKELGIMHTPDDDSV
jgi:hypothetical protein